MFDAIAISGDAADRHLGPDIVLTDLEFSNNGSSGGGGTGDVSVFQYNGDATFTNLKMVGNAGTNTGEQIGIQFRGVGSGDGASELPMGDVSFNNIDISGNYVRSFIGIQRYSDVTG